MRARRVLSAAWVAGLLSMLPALTLGHAELVSTSPEEGSNLDEAPTEVVMTFEGELQPDGSGFTVTDADGTEVGTGEVDLDVAERNVISGEVTITEPGIYTVSWTSVAADGHEEEGEFAFGFQATEPVPDTAMATAEAISPLTIAGGALLLVAGVLATRRLVAR